MDFKAKLKDVPKSSGVYMMLDDDGQIVYVGKAKNLNARLRQYFYRSANKSQKVALMMQSVTSFKYLITKSEIDALLTENNLIKKHAPKYNILLKDDKSYPFLRIDLKEEFPTIKLVRKLEDDGARYFGPYMLSVNIRDILDLIHTAFKVRDCSIVIGDNSSLRPCLNHHLSRCSAPCASLISQADYRKEIERVIAFLKGNDKEVEKILQQKMKQFSAEGNFEAAIVCRDKLLLLDNLVRKQISALVQKNDIDIFSMRSDGVRTAINWIAVRGGKILGGDNFLCDTADEGLSSFLFQFYQHNAPNVDEIVLEGLSDSKLLEEWLREKSQRKINVIEPKQGIRKQLLEMSGTNASDFLRKVGTQKERKYLRTTKAVAQLAEVLDLNILPNRIEGYDVSHISGTDKVASMVVFEKGEPLKAHYRKFKIKTVEGCDDFASIKETIERRLDRLSSQDDSFSMPPDLILIDGGLGQLSSAKKAICSRNQDIAVLALAERDETVFYEQKKIALGRDDLALRLLQRIRDEAHRFALSYHRVLRKRKMEESILKQIPNVGDSRVDALYKHFKTLSKIKEATIDELSMVRGISKKIAEEIYNHFRKK